MTERTQPTLAERQAALAEVDAYLRPCKCLTPEQTGTRHGYTCPAHRALNLLAPPADMGEFYDRFMKGDEFCPECNYGNLGHARGCSRLAEEV